jgi:hypothetical protein
VAVLLSLGGGRSASFHPAGPGRAGSARRLGPDLAVAHFAHPGPTSGGAPRPRRRGVRAGVTYPAAWLGRGIADLTAMRSPFAVTNGVGDLAVLAGRRQLLRHRLHPGISPAGSYRHDIDRDQRLDVANRRPGLGQYRVFRAALDGTLGGAAFPPAGTINRARDRDVNIDAAPDV